MNEELPSNILTIRYKIVFVGDPGIGKTSILNLLQQRVQQSNGIVKYFDCTKYHHLRWYQFLRQIIIEIGEK